MASDHIAGMGPKSEKIIGFSLTREAYIREDTDRIFAELSAGGIVTMPMIESEWNSYFGMLTDKFGINWMINVDKK